MELALTYALMDARRREHLKQEARLMGAPEEWRDFLLSDDHKISVFAGRRMRKTSMIAQRATMSKFNCHIYVFNDASVRLIYDMIHRIGSDEEIREGRIRTGRLEGDFARIYFENDRCVEIQRVPRNPRVLAAQQWRNREIFFDEYEHSDFEELMGIMENKIKDARHIVCVGSINRMEDTYAKRWFKDSDLSYYIDSDRIPPTRGHMPEEYRPTLARQFIENLPPLSYAFL